MPESQRFGRIGISDYFLDCKAEEQRHHVVHELVHCHVEAVFAIVRRTTPRRRFEPIRILAEYAVDSIARAWAETLPLPAEILGLPDAPVDAPAAPAA